MSEIQDIVENPMRLSKNIIEESIRLLRSYSTKNPSLEELAYCLEFVPKLKPKKIDSIPSPMNLNSKIRKNLKHHTHLSCPKHNDKLATKAESYQYIGEFSLEKDENETENNPYLQEEHQLKKESEFITLNPYDNSDEEDIDQICSDQLSKNKSDGSTNFLRKNLNKKHDDDDEELYLDEQGIFGNNNDEYELMKAFSYENQNFDFHKTRANSILRTLEAGCKNFKMDDD